VLVKRCSSEVEVHMQMKVPQNTLISTPRSLLAFTRHVSQFEVPLGFTDRMEGTALT
jgi:hypothetical protein